MTTMGHPLSFHARYSIAPMMAWTDRHYRYMARLISQNVLLYTEMVTSASLVRGNALYQLDHSPQEHPLALQLGGSNPAELARAAEVSAKYGFPEINLNVGCPSDRVQSGAFGAVLMKDPRLVADCLKAMKSACDAEITVKCRIGVDDQDPEEILPKFLDIVQNAGVSRVIIHARKAWLKGLSPKENRTVPPLDWPLVREMKAQFPELHLSLNGGVTSQEQVSNLLKDFDGVMVGRSAYHDPYSLLAGADQTIFNEPCLTPSRSDIAIKMMHYAECQLHLGARIGDITRHMLGLYAGQKGGRKWRQILSTSNDKTHHVIEQALDMVA